MGMISPNGKVALVTGAGSGVGRVAVLALLREGTPARDNRKRHHCSRGTMKRRHLLAIPQPVRKDEPEGGVFGILRHGLKDNLFVVHQPPACGNGFV
jgi:NAD(P)-dependent dehydrogenase (short-subunit alcohol dehydrogenase family)